MIRTSSLVVASLVLLQLAVAAAPSVVRDPGTHAARLPPNIRVSSDLEPIVSKLLARSPTFRRQCAVIAASNVDITVRVTVALRQSDVRARATIGRSAPGQLWALIELPPVAEYAELLPHELEHVIEQIEGIDLAEQTRAGNPQVSVSADGAFETARAQAAGHSAAAEFYAQTDPVAAAAARTASRLWRALCRRAARPGVWATKMRAGVHKEF